MRRNLGREVLYSSLVLGSFLLVTGVTSVHAGAASIDQTAATSVVEDNQTPVAAQAIDSTETTAAEEASVPTVVASESSNSVNNTDESQPSVPVTTSDDNDNPPLVRTENNQDLYLQGITAADFGLSESGLPGWIVSTLTNGAVAPVTSIKDNSGNYQIYNETPVNEQSLLGVVDNFSIFTFNNLKLTNISVNGRVAVGGDLTLTNAAINGPDSEYNLIVGGQSVLKTYSSVNGRGILIDQNTNAWDTLWAGQKYTRMNTAAFFATLQQQLLAQGNQMLQITTTGTTVTPTATNGHQLKLVGSGSDGANTDVFSVTTDQINATFGGSIDITNVTQIDGTPKQVIINVTGDNAIFSNGSILYNGQPLANNKTLAATITWNMPQTVAIESSAFAQVGTIVAPLATFYMSNGSIDAAKLVVYKYNTTDINETSHIKAEFKLQNSDEVVHDPINYMVAKGDVTDVGPILFSSGEYILVGYSLNDGEIQQVSETTAIPVTYRATDQTITFYYQLAKKGGKTNPVQRLANGQKRYEVVTDSIEVEQVKQQIADLMAVDQDKLIGSSATITLSGEALATEFKNANGQKHYAIVTDSTDVEQTKRQIADLIAADQTNGIAASATITIVDDAPLSVSYGLSAGTKAYFIGKVPDDAPHVEFKLADGQKYYEVTTESENVGQMKQVVAYLIAADQTNGIAASATITTVDDAPLSVSYGLSAGTKAYFIGKVPDDAPFTEFKLAPGQKHYEVSTAADVVAIKQRIDGLIAADQQQGIHATADIKLLDARALVTHNETSDNVTNDKQISQIKQRDLESVHSVMLPVKVNADVVNSDKDRAGINIQTTLKKSRAGNNQLLPQTGAANNIIGTIVGILMLGLAFVVSFKNKKLNKARVGNKVH